MKKEEASSRSGEEGWQRETNKSLYSRVQQDHELHGASDSSHLCCL
jgi:hypothetical protein